MARFYRSTQQPFLSQFVPENLDLQQNYFDNLQKNQDSYQANINGLNIKSDAMENDIPGAVEARKRIDGQLSDLRKIDYNDPNQKKQALQVIPNVQNAISAFGEIGARTKKKQEFDNIQKELDSRYKDLPMMKSYMTSKLRETNLDPNRAIYFENGVPKNTEIVLPKEFNYIDLNENISKLLKDTEFDQISVNSGLSPEKGHEALYSYMNGNIQEKKGEKIYNSLKNRILSNGNQVESIKADASYYGGNPVDRLEQALQGAVIGGKFKRTNIDRKLYTDDAELDRNARNEELKLGNQTTSTQSENLEGVSFNNPYKDMNFDKNGNLKAVVNSPYTYKGTSSSTRSGLSVSSTPQSGGVDTEASKLQKAQIQSLKNDNPDLQGLSDEQTIKASIKARESLSSESIPLLSVGNVAAKNIGQALSRNMEQREMYVWDSKGSKIGGNKDLVLKELGISDEELKKVVNEGISGFTQAGPQAGSYYVEVPNSKGVTRRVMISPDEEFKNIFKVSQALNEARKTMIKTDFTPFEQYPYYSIKVEPQIQRDGKANWKYTEIIKDNSGNIVTENPTTLEDLQKEEKLKLENSNYLGSQIGTLKPHTTN